MISLCDLSSLSKVKVVIRISDNMIAYNHRSVQQQEQDIYRNFAIV